MKSKDRRLRSSLENKMQEANIKRNRQIQLEKERSIMDKKARRKWHAVDLSWMTMSLVKTHPEGFTQDIKLHFDYALSFKEITERLDLAFGDL